MGNASHEKTATKEKTFQKTVTVLLAALLLWQVFDFVYTQQIVRSHHEYERGGEGMDLINPKVSRYRLPDIAQNLKTEITPVIEGFKKEGKVSDVGFYVRDLDSGYGFGINENEKFVPASLLKIITMISYYKSAETNPAILQKKLVYAGTDYNKEQTFKPTDEMVSGKEYTVEELINRSVVYSDNNAHDMLIQNINDETYQRVFLELGIPFSNSPTEKTMTPKLYANIFRVLYNATFLNQENSQKALSFLSQVNFDGGIQAGINGGVRLSNKFGERIIQENGTTVHYLHDCGIVYAKHPYVLCVMTKGEETNKLEDAIVDISAIIYKKMKY